MRKISLLYKFLITGLISHFLGITPLHARWATYEDAPAELEFYNAQVHINKNGTWEQTIEKQVKILNERGRELFGIQQLHFNGNIQKVVILEAKTIFQGKEYKIPKEMIEVKPLASDTKAFDQLFQILIPFHHVGKGSQLYLKYRVRYLKAALPDYFARNFHWGDGAYWQKSSLQITSALPLHLMTNDPGGHLIISHAKKGKLEKIDISLKKPVCHVLMNEQASNQVPESLKVWIGLSTVASFEELSRNIARDYEKVIEEDLPPLHESIKQKAKTLASFADQLNCVTSLLSEKIRYMGDWRTIQGRFHPRSLKTIADTGLGDCKDFSASLAAILKSMGIKAQVALTIRGMGYLPPEKTLPSLDNFNHAIVKVTSSEGEISWIDPTNFTSMATGIFPDIAARPALILDSRNPSYEKIPEIDYSHAQIIREEQISLSKEDILKTQGTIEVRGELAESYTGAGLTASLQSIKETLIESLSGELTPQVKEINLPELASRIVKDLKADYYFEQEGALLPTNLGVGMALKTGLVSSFISTTPDQEGTTFIGMPLKFTRKIIIQEPYTPSLESLNYQIETPWLKAGRKIYAKNGNIEVEEYIAILKSFITPEEIRSPLFENLKKTIKKYIKHVLIVIPSKTAREPIAKS